MTTRILDTLLTAAIAYVLLRIVGCAYAGEGASTHEVCYIDVPCFNTGAKCVLNPDSLLGSGTCEGGTPSVQLSDNPPAPVHIYPRLPRTGFP